MEDQTKQRINDIIYRLLISPSPGYKGINTVDDIKPEHSFSDDFGADSLDTLGMIMEIEYEFRIEIPDEACETWQTVQDVYTYFEGLNDE